MQPDEDAILEYDRWSWHTEGTFPKDQPPEQGYVHIGMFVAWLVCNDMLDPGWAAGSGLETAVDSLRNRELSPCSLRDQTEGRLTGEMLTAEGAAFASAYYAPEYGYATDWRRAFGRRADRYAVPDSWETYDWIAPRIERRHRQWVEAGRPELMPMSRLLAALMSLARSRAR
jgi:hypothetical protein